MLCDPCGHDAIHIWHLSVLAPTTPISCIPSARSIMSNLQALQTDASGFLDLSATPIARDYPKSYIKVLDNVFTPEECASLIALAESAGTWEAAKISTSKGDHIDLDYRNSGRILRFDHKTAEQIYQRLLPHIQELVEIQPGGEWEGVVGTPKRVSGKWKLLGYVTFFF